MDIQAILKGLKPKPLTEILQRLNEVIHKHRRRFLERSLKPCPINCTKRQEFAVPISFQVFNSEFKGKQRGIMCEGCGSHNKDICKKSSEFSPQFTKEELMEQFKANLRDPQILLREYRDIAFFFWVIGAFDEKVDEGIIQKVEPHAKKGK